MKIENKKYELKNKSGEVSHLIELEFKGLNKPNWEDNEKEHLSFNVRITKTINNKTISFMFFDSLHNTKMYEKSKNNERTFINNRLLTLKEFKNSFYDNLLYSVLCSIALDYYTDFKDEYDFFSTFGYEPSRKNKMLYYRVLEQGEKLQSVFSEEDIKQFDENDDILKETIKNKIKEVV